MWPRQQSYTMSARLQWVNGNIAFSGREGRRDEVDRPIVELSKRRAGRQPNRNAAAVEANPLMGMRLGMRRQDSKPFRRNARAGPLDGDAHDARAADSGAYRLCLSVGCAR
jgi:hypothetical protein